MTVQAANRNNNQHYASGIKSKFSGGASDNAKHPVGQRFDAAQQKYSSTSSATQLKAKFGHGRKVDDHIINNVAPENYSKNYTNHRPIDGTDGGRNELDIEKGVMNRNTASKEKISSVSFTPPTSRKGGGGGGIGLKWEMQHSQESSSSISSWKGNKNVFSKSYSNIQDLAIDDGRGFVPSEVAKDPNKKEFLTNLSKRIFSNPETKVIQKELQRRRKEETNVDNKKRSASAGRSTGPFKIPSSVNGREGGRFQRTFKVKHTR